MVGTSSANQYLKHQLRKVAQRLAEALWFSDSFSSPRSCAASQPVPQEKQSKAAEDPPGKNAPQQVGPGSEQLDTEIPRHSSQSVLCVTNRPVKRTLDPAVHLLLRRCQCLRQARFDDGADLEIIDGGWGAGRVPIMWYACRKIALDMSASAR